MLNYHFFICIFKNIHYYPTQFGTPKKTKRKTKQKNLSNIDRFSKEIIDISLWFITSATETVVIQNKKNFIKLIKNFKPEIRANLY